jgi:tetratricopeptide (TPR) repeat protein
MSKKLILGLAMSALIGVGSISETIAQPNKVVTAYNYHNYFMKDKNLDDINNAEKAINEAVVHEKTIGDPKAWFYRGKIYHSIFESKDEALKDRKDESLNATYESYSKSLELDVKNKFSKEVEQRLQVVQIQYINLGVSHFETKSYANAAQAFEKSIEIAEKFNKVDTLAMFNAALANERAENYEKATVYYQKLIDANAGGSDNYLFMSSSFKKLNKIQEAKEIVQKGRAKYPENKGLIIEELNFYLMEGKFEDAINNLKLAIAADPSNKILFLSLGSLYDKLANEDGVTKEKADNYLDEAVKSYKKALELDAKYFDALYNLGALYFNQGVKLNDIANNIKDNKLYAKEIKKADDKFELALPYLEQAYEIDDKDQGTLMSLKQLYARTGNTAKYKEVNDKIKK